MDLEKSEQIKSRHFNHWAEKLEPGDKCLATIRHKTDGSKNRQNVEVIVVANFHNDSRIVGWDKLNFERTFSINYCELTEIVFDDTASSTQKH